MKPRIRMVFGVWECRMAYLTFAGRVRVIGHGYTPKEAYDDWQTQWRSTK